jgi:hypothetical protein
VESYGKLYRQRIYFKVFVRLRLFQFLSCILYPASCILLPSLLPFTLEVFLKGRLPPYLGRVVEDLFLELLREKILLDEMVF